MIERAREKVRRGERREKNIETRTNEKEEPRQCARHQQTCAIGFGVEILKIKVKRMT